MKIAYLCDQSPLNRNLYSGGNARIYDALRTHVGDVTILSNTWHMAEPVRRLVEAMPDAITIRARWRLHLALSRVIAAGVRRELRRDRFDVLFCPYSFHSLLNVKPPYPMLTIHTSDATPTTYKQSEVGQSFGSYWSLARWLDPWVLRRETKVFRNTDLLIWPTDWLKGLADDLYGLDDGQSLVIPWGANIEWPEPETEPLSISPDGPVNLLVIGRDWFAKGGPMAVDTMKALRSAGIDARLTVIGCNPPDFHMTPEVTVYPSLDKSVPAELKQFQDALRQAHFLVMPSFESFGFAFCEASAYSLPSLCLRVGGVPVRDGVNGHALPQGSTEADFASLIQQYLSNPAAYAALRKTTRQEFETRLNWDAWGKSVKRLIDSRLKDQ